MKNKDPQIFLSHILENASYAQENVRGVDFKTFLKDRKTRDAVVREIEIIGEAVKNLPMVFRDQHPEIPWKKIAGMRDEIVHEYFDIDWDLVWNVVDKRLPELEKQIKELLG